MNIINLLNKLPFWLVISASSVVTILGDLMAKYWSQNRRGSFFWVAIISYSLAGLFFISTLLKQGLVIASVLWSVAATVGFLVIGLVIFHEHLNTAQAVGVAFGVVGLMILALS